MRWADVERMWDLILERGLRAPGFRMVRGGATLARSDYCRAAGVGNQQLSDLPEPNRVLELYADGATVVLQGLQHFDVPYARLSTNLALDLDQPVQVNAYLSPVETKGLDLHFDYHDVIVVQLAGSKRWRVWEPIERTRRPAKSGAAIPLPQFDELGTPLVDLVMHAGDCLALPRGFPHAAETVDDESVHLTIGIMALTWERMLRNAIGEPSATALADRLAVAGLESSYDPAAALDWLRTTIAGDRFRDEVAKAVWRRQPRTRLRPRRESFDLAADMPVRVTPGPLLWLTLTDSSARLHLGDRVLTMPVDAYPLVRDVLATSGPFTSKDVRGALDVDSAMTVLQRLVVEGVLARG